MVGDDVQSSEERTRGGAMQWRKAAQRKKERRWCCYVQSVGLKDDAKIGKEDDGYVSHLVERFCEEG